ncbi:MAG: helicase HerA-like domain-containing protein [Moheibacter sp.]
MSIKETFLRDIQSGYHYKGDKIVLGKAKLNGEVLSDAEILVALKTMNRHGLIAGATGTGKTKSLQILAEQLSLKGIPSLLMDIKGDLSGIAAPGQENKAITERQRVLEMDYTPMGAPVEFLSLSHEPGARLRATVTEFGPILFSKILELNDTQTGIISIVFKYCDDKGYPLLDLKDIREALRYLSDDDSGKQELASTYGNISKASLGTILRKIVTLEQQGADLFFGEPSFEVNDLVKTRDGKGIVNIIRLTDIQNRPSLFSTFMMSLLAEIYESFPETGDPDKPKLVIFIDEAHLIFKEASKTLLDQMETMVKLIRSKGVGLFFCTQVPGDIPDGVLGQLGLKIQHALRGFTAKDRKQIQKAVENYPITSYYKADEVITQLGIGEAFVTALNEKGIPTPLAYTYMRAPLSRMDILSETEIETIIRKSELAEKYSQEIDRESAYEILSKRLKTEESAGPVQSKKPSGRTKKEKSVFETIITDSTTKSFIRTIGNQIIRGLFGKTIKRR